jgi:hypothetical protein
MSAFRNRAIVDFRPWILAAALSGAALVTAVPAPSSAEQAAANLGTLTCVVDPATKEPFGVERDLSCSFAPLVGPKADFVGVVKRLGADIAGDRKIVLAWSVLGPQADMPVNALEGRYLGNLSTDRGEGKPGLVGGAKSEITLEPLTLDPGLGDNAAISVLELDLSGMKA